MSKIHQVPYTSSLEEYNILEEKEDEVTKINKEFIKYLLENHKKDTEEILDYLKTNKDLTFSFRNKIFKRVGYEKLYQLIDNIQKELNTNNLIIDEIKEKVSLLVNFKNISDKKKEYIFNNSIITLKVIESILTKINNKQHREEIYKYLYLIIIKKSTKINAEISKKNKEVEKIQNILSKNEIIDYLFDNLNNIDIYVLFKLFKKIKQKDLTKKYEEKYYSISDYLN